MRVEEGPSVAVKAGNSLSEEIQVTFCEAV